MAPPAGPAPNYNYQPRRFPSTSGILYTVRFGPRWARLFWGRGVAIGEKGREVRSPGMTVTPGPMIARIPDGTSTSVPSTIRSTSPTVCWPRADPARTIARIKAIATEMVKNSLQGLQNATLTQQQNSVILPRTAHVHATCAVTRSPQFPLF